MTDDSNLVETAFVLTTVSAKSAPTHLNLLGCAAVSALGYEGDSR
jgi:hypothetical protein